MRFISSMSRVVSAKFRFKRSMWSLIGGGGMTCVLMLCWSMSESLEEKERGVPRLGQYMRGVAERPLPRRSAHREWYPNAENNTGGRMNGRTSRKPTLPRENYGFISIRVRRKSDHGIGSDAERGVLRKGG